MMTGWVALSLGTAMSDVPSGDHSKANPSPADAAVPRWSAGMLGSHARLG
jgi:hypothetical protein